MSHPSVCGYSRADTEVRVVPREYPFRASGAVVSPDCPRPTVTAIFCEENRPCVDFAHFQFTRLLQTEAHVELEGNPLGEADDDGDDGAEMWKGYPEIVAASAHVVEAVCILHVLLISDS